MCIHYAECKCGMRVRMFNGLPRAMFHYGMKGEGEEKKVCVAYIMLNVNVACGCTCSMGSRVPCLMFREREDIFSI